MKCDRCAQAIAQGDDHDHLGQTLCEDCYMDALSPTRTCDPWAVHSAKTFEAAGGGTQCLTPVQSEILAVLESTGGLPPEELLERIEGVESLKALEREFAALRHMEKVRAEKRGDAKVWRLW